ncbi:hypothetical protein [Actinocatenispora rupis]|uniref:Uncharacterized protein n=1 Tax=Actinocatenispora rupis TaxID=519421 RepID=A0A8J3N7Z1_9ACTN|nr:hypothetical protein [Actinocatenispora rupis]GID09769.1 hypothetical protein Aru02nite_06580 [Actinocatenispora rupis]
MILVQVQQSWLSVLTGSTTPDEAVLGDWPGVDAQSLQQYGDVLLGIYRNTVIAVYDLDLAKTQVLPGGKTRFGGTPSTTWGHLLGQPNPGQPWGNDGYAKPVQYLDTRAAGQVAPQAAPAGSRRAAIDGIVLTVDPSGAATVHVPAGRSVTVRTA